MITATAVPLSRLASLRPGPAAADQLSSSCGPSIAVSCLLATFAALAALACAARIRAAPRAGLAGPAGPAVGVRGAGWTCAAAVAVGMAVWSTQLAGGVSCEYSGATSFDLRMTLLSALIVPVATGVGLTIAAADPTSARRLLVGGALSGAGWSTATFLTIAAMRAAHAVGYDVLLAALSVVMNVGTATVLCWVAFRLGDRWRQALVAALLLGAATRGGYYTALAAVRVSPGRDHVWSPGVDPFALGLVTAAGSTIVLMFIAVAAVGGLIHPRVRGGDVIAWPSAAAATRRARTIRGATAAARRTTMLMRIPLTEDGQGAQRPGRGGRPDGSTVPDGSGLPAGGTQPRPTCEDLTYEELTYVGLSRGGLADDVELPEPADDESGDVAPEAGPAIDDVLAAAPPDAVPVQVVEPIQVTEPIQVVEPLSGALDVAQVGEGSFASSALAAAMARAAQAGTAPLDGPPPGEAPTAGGAPGPGRLSAPDSGELVAILVPAGSLTAPPSIAPASPVDEAQAEGAGLAGESFTTAAADPSGPIRVESLDSRVLPGAEASWLLAGSTTGGLPSEPAEPAIPAGLVEPGAPAGSAEPIWEVCRQVYWEAQDRVAGSADGPRDGQAYGARSDGLSVERLPGAPRQAEPGGADATAHGDDKAGGPGSVETQPPPDEPALSFPPPPWWFRATAPGCVAAARRRGDDPGAPTKPLRLVPNRPPR
ncbi:MHYT domain-containing protein [Pseudofrankia saprophytica]|uniref:MHYT domain-containing protein n=1 Tax=Pseudofrankia saprophytica TaxID=298655 RepID=UPI000234D047|nr:MHYT domain-containing protein [Pseudofrankia saprophytica]